MALIPTLTLWHVESRGETPEEFEKGMNKVVLPELRAYSEAGGQSLFGTDVGYIEQFDTSEEFVWMSRAGMSFQQILGSLTTNPAQRFGYSNRSGRIAKGIDADLGSCALTLRRTPRHFPRCATPSEAGTSSIPRSEVLKPAEATVQA